MNETGTTQIADLGPSVGDVMVDRGIINTNWHDGAYIAAHRAWHVVPPDPGGVSVFNAQAYASGFIPTARGSHVGFQATIRSDVPRAVEIGHITSADALGSWLIGYAGADGAAAWGGLDESRMVQALTGVAARSLFGTLVQDSPIIVDIPDTSVLAQGMYIGDTIGRTQTVTGAIQSGQYTVTGLNVTAGGGTPVLFVGMRVTGGGIPDETYVGSINPADPTVMTLTKPATTTGTVTLYILAVQHFDRAIQANTTILSIDGPHQITISSPAVISALGCPLAVSTIGAMLIGKEIGVFNYGPTSSVIGGAQTDESGQLSPSFMTTNIWLGGAGSSTVTSLISTTGRYAQAFKGAWLRQIIYDYFYAESPGGAGAAGLRVEDSSMGLVANTTLDSPNLTGFTNMADLRVGMRVSGLGIRAASKIVSMDRGAGVAVMNQAAGATQTGVSLRFTRWGAAVIAPRDVAYVGRGSDGTLFDLLKLDQQNNMVVIGDPFVGGVVVPNNIALRGRSKDALSTYRLLWLRNDDVAQLGDTRPTRIFGDGVQVLGARRPGWTQPTGSPFRGAWDTVNIDHPTLARVVMAWISDAFTHGLVGP